MKERILKLFFGLCVTYFYIFVFLSIFFDKFNYLLAVSIFYLLAFTVVSGIGYFLQEKSVSRMVLIYGHLTLLFFGYIYFFKIKSNTINEFRLNHSEYSEKTSSVVAKVELDSLIAREQVQSLSDVHFVNLKIDNKNAENIPTQIDTPQYKPLEVFGSHKTVLYFFQEIKSIVKINDFLYRIFDSEGNLVSEKKSDLYVGNPFSLDKDGTITDAMKQGVNDNQTKEVYLDNVFGKTYIIKIKNNLDFKNTLTVNDKSINISLPHNIKYISKLVFNGKGDLVLSGFSVEKEAKSDSNGSYKKYLIRINDYLHAATFEVIDDFGGYSYSTVYEIVGDNEFFFDKEGGFYHTKVTEDGMNFYKNKGLLKVVSGFSNMRFVFVYEGNFYFTASNSKNGFSLYKNFEEIKSGTYLSHLSTPIVTKDGSVFQVGETKNKKKYLLRNGVIFSNEYNDVYISEIQEGEYYIFFIKSN